MLLSVLSVEFEAVIHFILIRQLLRHRLLILSAGDDRVLLQVRSVPALLLDIAQQRLYMFYF